MAYTGLLDGGLHVYINSTEYRTYVHGLEFESTSQGDAWCTFWVQPSDPLNVPATYSDLKHGALVQVTHTYDSHDEEVLFYGYIINDPRMGEAGEYSNVPVECGGVLEVCKWREDCEFVFTESDTDRWFEHKRVPKWATVEVSNHIEICADEGTKVPMLSTTRAAMICYVPYLGFDYMLNNPSVSGFYGPKRITGSVKYDLNEGLKAGLYWATAYKDNRNPSNYTLIKSWSHSKGTYQLNETFGGTNGAGYVFLAMWRDQKHKAKKEEINVVSRDRYIRISNPELYLTSNGNEKRLDQAMLAIANFVGLHTTTDTAQLGLDPGSTGSVNQTLAARGPTNPAAACEEIAMQCERLVDWGWHQGTFRCKPLTTSFATIRAASNYYKVSSSTDAMTWQAGPQPEDVNPARVVRLCYGRLGSSDWPPGTPATVAWPKNQVGLTGGTPFRGATCPVQYVDFGEHNYSSGKAQKVARKLANHLGHNLRAQGTVTLRGLFVLDKNDANYPAAYLHGGDWIENTSYTANLAPGPLFITRCRVSVDTGVVDMDVGLPSDALVEQLEEAGAIGPVKRSKKRRRKRKR